MLTCSRCGLAKPVDEFWPARLRKSGRQARCKDCTRATRQPTQQRPTVVLRCEDCRRLFRRRADHATRAGDGAVRCNPCSRSARSAGRELPTRRTGAKVACEQCGTEFYRSASRLQAKHKFCTRACANAWQKAHPRPWVGQVDNSGQRNGQYKDGSRVGTNTNARRKVRTLVAQRDGDWCLLCGQPPKGLHLHRVIYGSEGGAYEVVNCVQLCGHHHAVVHGRKQVWQPLLVGYLATDPGPDSPVLRPLRQLLA